MAINLTDLSYQSWRVGDYYESAIVNGHPSWINAYNAIWYSDGSSDWVVGSISNRGGDLVGIAANNIGTTCPYNIAWNGNYWNGASWVIFNSSVISVTCSQDKGKNN